jgi:hypothetical protein
MSIYSNRVTVGTAATLLVPASNQQQEITLLNAGTTVVRVGGPDVTTNAWGLPVIPENPNVSRTFFYSTLQPNDSVWGITAAGQAAVNVWAVRKN